jgi:hypothetical protein
MATYANHAAEVTLPRIAPCFHTTCFVFYTVLPNLLAREKW